MFSHESCSSYYLSFFFNLSIRPFIYRSGSINTIVIQISRVEASITIPSRWSPLSPSASDSSWPWPPAQLLRRSLRCRPSSPALQSTDLRSTLHPTLSFWVFRSLRRSMFVLDTSSHMSLFSRISLSQDCPLKRSNYTSLTQVQLPVSRCRFLSNKCRHRFRGPAWPLGGCTSSLLASLAHHPS